MRLTEHTVLWNYASVKIMDVRYTIMGQGEVLRSYLLPASAFLYTVRGSARVWLDGKDQAAKRFHVIHGGKGLCLDIAAEDRFEYYMILYKAIIPLPCRREILELMERSNPFQSQYAFGPYDPLHLFDKAEQMYSEWKRTSSLEKLHVKSLFYQFVYGLMRQMHDQGIEPFKPDLAAQAVRYIRERYSRPVTLEMLAGDLECSVGYLSKLFKEKMNTSPIHYLGEVRVNEAIKLLLQTDATLQEIAERVGYPDGHTLSRSFKRYKGVSPARYRMQWSLQDAGEDLPYARGRFAIPPNKRKFYSGDIENHYHYKGEADLSMYRSVKLTAMTVILCLSLLLGACSNGANSNGASQTPSQNVETPASATAGNAGESQKAAPQAETRIVSTLKGDVEVPAEPQRVASDQYMGHLLKLGIIPVGVRDFMLTEAWIEKAGIPQETMDKIENLGGFPMNPEKLIELEPDLIIGSIEDNIEQYQKIGTTVFIPYWEGLSTAGPLEKFRRISEVFGKEQEADQWIAEYQQKVEDAKQQIAGIIKEGETVSVVQLSEKAIYVLAAEGGNYGSATIYQMLKLPPTEKAATMEDGFANVSLEVLQDYLGDHVFVYVNSEEDAESIMNSEIWKAAPAVKNGHVYMYGQFGDEFVMEDPYSLELQLERIVNVLLESRK